MNVNLQQMDDLSVAYQMLPLPPPEMAIMSNHGGVGERSENIRTVEIMRIIDEDCNSSSSSSIGNNSDDDDENGDCEEDAQSSYRSDQNSVEISNGSIDDAIQALEEALPIRRGMSTFYDGKSKSFTCLANMWRSSPPSITDIAKPENALNRKRRNLLASTLLSPKTKTRAFRLSDINTGRITKKPKTATLHFGSERDDTNLKNSNLSSMRSFSMVNLHRCSSRFGLKSS